MGRETSKISLESVRRMQEGRAKVKMMLHEAFDELESLAFLAADAEVTTATAAALTRIHEAETALQQLGVELVHRAQAAEGD